MNKTSKELIIEAGKQAITAKGPALKALQDYSKACSSLAIATKEKNEAKKLIVEAFGLETGEAKEFFNGNGDLVASWLPEYYNADGTPKEIKDRYRIQKIRNKLKIH